VAEKMFGYEPDSLSGTPLETLLPARFKSSHVKHREDFNKNPTPRRMGVGRDLMAMRKDRTEFPVEVSLSHHKIGSKLIIMAFVIDITLRKRSEEALRRSEEQLLLYAAELEKRVQERTDSLNVMVRDLEKANQDATQALDRERELNELKTKFMSIASHEFRTPLSTILSSASLVHQYNEKNDKEKIEKHVSRIKSSVNHLTGILNDFLSLGKLEEGRIEVLKEAMQLENFLEEVVEETWPILKSQQKIRVDFSGSSRELQCDPRILRNILFNLLSNASKYSADEKEIFIKVEYKEEFASISVRDEGIGIPKDEIKHLFDRFFRASNATNIQGSGLGLNIVKKYLDLLNGTLAFSTAEGKGTSFTIKIPY
jgi:PAS domain S-box-containing protein